LTDRHRAAAPSDPTADYFVDSGEMRITGGELEISGSLSPQWDVIFGYTYMDSDVKEASSDDAVFMLMPENIASLWTKYAFDGGILDGLEIGGGISGMSGFHSSQGVEAPGYAVVDGMLGYAFTPKLSGQLNVYNVFDREYYTRVGSTNTFNFVGQPASALLTLRYDF
jgi:outer-membrane receptor for ferric coprogen and ferric-rhodotorulic acid